jgi:hydroxymethylbilane synthase
VSAGSIRIGTRASELALTQTQTVADSLAARSGREVEIVRITTEGDTSKASLANLGGTGMFAGALRQALTAGDCDVVVHSLKDLPTAPADGLVIAAVPKRVDVRDALVARDGLTLDTLPEGAKVGTGSPRRQAQLRSRRADLDVVDIRGNIDTRLGRVGDDLDAVVLAGAGLQRIGRTQVITQWLETAWWPTAPGQGALAVETRVGDRDLVRRLEHAPTRLAVEAERGVLAALEAGCAAPLGAAALLEDGLLFLSARVYAADGSSHLTASHAMYAADVQDPAAELAQRVADELLELGAADLAPLGPSK